MTKHEVKIGDRSASLTNYIERGSVESELDKVFKNSKKSEFLYLRGRRRVGKSTLLKRLQKQNENAFYFIGMKDESVEKTLVRFAREWDQFQGLKSLTRIKASELNWSLIFDEITQSLVHELKKGSGLKNKVLIFDEIQWVAKGFSGFIGTLKEKWLDWEQTQKIQVILCGSSNKFFYDQAGGEEKVLRGLKTRADLWLTPLHLNEVKKNYFEKWNVHEVLLAYMFLGGIPYYLNQLERNKKFIPTLNAGLFLKTSIFLNEVDEILNLEFNKSGIKRTKQILAAMGVLGSTQAQIKKKIPIPESTLSETITKLHDYSLIKEKRIYKPKNSKLNSQVYFFDDPYLLFYFGVLEKYAEEIRENEEGPLLPEILGSTSSYYIPQFTGRAFEVLLRNLFLCETNETQTRLLKLLNIPNKKYELFDSYDGDNEIDLLIEHKGLRTLYAIECKWTNSPEIINEGINKLKLFREGHPEVGEKLELILITNYNCKKTVLDKAEQLQVKIVEVEGVFV